LDVKSVYATMWSGGCVVLPKHIWKPIAEGSAPDDYAADPNMIGSGPWRFQEYVGFSHVLLVANKPESTVQTNHAGSTPITSEFGFFRVMDWRGLAYIYRPEEYKRDYKLIEGLGAENSSICFDLSNMNAVYNMTDIERYVNFTLDGGLEYENTTYRDLPPANDPHGLDISLNINPFANAKVTKTLYWHRKTNKPWWQRNTYEVGYKITGTVKAGVRIRISFSFFHIITKKVYDQVIGVDRSFELNVKYTFKTWGKFGTYCKKYNYDPGTLLWVTIKEDIAGSTWYDDNNMPLYPYKSQLPTPDIKVDIKDVALAAKGFGSYPGHDRWATVADITGDYQIDIKDIASIAKQFGWVG
ncbi:hypothetical protein KAU55_04485, partial [Candidatus Bathyarchaeota archaeon]|nr:hypothetical protein [Candidatus Bathyarchaeota archaeon]